jgi:transcriptional regulator with XRE-family HTH domain
MHDIGRAIKVRRAMYGINQTQLAERVGIKQAYMSQLETGVRPMTDELQEKIAAALGCKSEELTRWQQAA